MEFAETSATVETGKVHGKASQEHLQAIKIINSPDYKDYCKSYWIILVGTSIVSPP